MNGDTFFEIDLLKMLELLRSKNADVTMALKPMNKVTRYGIVEINEEGRIVNFIEKGERKTGLVNGGFYVISKNFLQSLKFSEKFSFEHDLLQRYFRFYKFYGIAFDTYFIDIGVKENYERAKAELVQKCR